MSESEDKINTPSLPEFFREQVREALDHQKIRVPEGVEFYLVNLLKDCTKTEDLYGTPPEGFREEPLAFLFSRALKADAALRIKLLRRLGDFSLYISGFFPSSLTRQLVDVSYYIQMGESAYGSLSKLLNRHAAFSEIFEELARRFVAYVDVLTEVSEKSTFRKDADLLRLYELWLKTGSERAKKLLSQQGILPVLGTSLKIQ
jgi:hypothetical protein